MKFKVITLFPQFITSLRNYSIIGRAYRNKLIKIETIDLRGFGLGKYKQVDDRPFGGSVGMLLRVDVVAEAIKSAIKPKSAKRRIILLSPQGKQFNQKMAERLSAYNELVLVCGHYEGFDSRIRDLVDEEISIGPYILTGGEIPAMVLIDAISRYKKRVLGKFASKDNETFSVVDKKKIIEYPQYTRPREYRGKAVPDVLLSGDHAQIKKWQDEHTRRDA